MTRHHSIDTAADTARDDAHEDITDEQPAPIDLRSLFRLHPRLLIAAGLVSLLMIPVGIFLAALGVAVLEFSGGAARDTGIVVAIAGFLVADFWGGGIVAALTRVRAPQVAIAWGIARLVVLVLIALIATGLAPVIPIQLAIAVPAAWAGARVARKQAALRRQIRAERDTADSNL